MPKSQKYTAHFCFDLCFDIPKGIDLEDESMVESSEVRNLILYITLVDGEVIQVDPIQNEDRPIIPFNGWVENNDDDDDSDNETDKSGSDDSDDEEEDSCG